MAQVYTPTADNKDIIELLKIIDSQNPPIVIDIDASNEDKESDCTNIVREKVKTDGGQIVYGWQIWHKIHLVDAEFHAVWKTPNGELKDITPKPDFLKSILFVEDERIIYEGKQIDNIRLNITNNELVDHYIESYKALYRLQNKGERALCYDLNEILSQEELIEINHIFKITGLLENMVYVGATMDSPCLCGCNRMHKDCYGKDFMKKIQNVY